MQRPRGRGLSSFVELVRYYGLFALLSVVVLPQPHISQAGISVVYIIGNVGALAGGLLMAALFDRVGHRRMVALTYLLSAAGIAVLAATTSSGSALWVTIAFVVANAFSTAAWTSAYPTFSDLFPTHLRGVGVGASVAIGRIGRSSAPSRCHPRREPRRERLLPAGSSVLAGRRRCGGRVRVLRRGRWHPTVAGSPRPALPPAGSGRFMISPPTRKDGDRGCA